MSPVLMCVCVCGGGGGGGGGGGYSPSGYVPAMAVFILSIS